MLVGEILQYLDPEFLITAFGTIGLIVIVFAETGLFFGFFLPGDSLLFTAGLLASLPDTYFSVPFWLLVVSICLAAIVGDSVGYWFGDRVKEKLFTKDDSLFFKKQYAEQAQIFFERYGVKSLVIARFIPIVRTFTPIVAGVGKMDYGKFLIFNIVGGILWGAGVTSLGYFLGQRFPQLRDYLWVVIVVIILVSFLPVIWEVYKKRRGMGDGEYTE